MLTAGFSATFLMVGMYAYQSLLSRQHYLNLLTLGWLIFAIRFVILTMIDHLPTGAGSQFR